MSASSGLASDGCRRRARLQRHPADRAVARPVAHDLGVHRAGPVAGSRPFGAVAAFKNRRRRRARRAAEEGRGRLLEPRPAAGAAEVVGPPLEAGALRHRARHRHSADGILFGLGRDHRQATGRGGESVRVLQAAKEGSSRENDSTPSTSKTPLPPAAKGASPDRLSSRCSRSFRALEARARQYSKPIWPPTPQVLRLPPIVSVRLL